MIKNDVKELDNGLYRAYWNDGGDSVAAVGSLPDGNKWLAPINWVVPCIDPDIWAIVDKVKFLRVIE